MEKSAVGGGAAVGGTVAEGGGAAFSPQAPNDTRAMMEMIVAMKNLFNLGNPILLNFQARVRTGPAIRASYLP